MKNINIFLYNNSEIETQSEHEYKWSIEGIETIKFDSFNKLLFRFINKY